MWLICPVNTANIKQILIQKYYYAKITIYKSTYSRSYLTVAPENAPVFKFIVSWL